MSKIEQLLVHIQSIFPDKILADYYDKTKEKEIWIEDSEKANKILPHTILPEELPVEKTFKIENPDTKDIIILAVDGNGIVGTSQSSCDAAFFDNTCFCLAEFKYNATSDSQNAVDRNIRKGTDQLELTIQKFETDKILPMGYKLEAYFGKPLIYPRTNPKLQRRAARFSNNYKVTLREANVKLF